MNVSLLRTLYKETKHLGFSERQIDVYLRQLLLAQIFKNATYARSVPASFSKVVRPFLRNLTLCPEGTSHALTPEIFALLREKSMPNRKSKGVFYTPWDLGMLLAKETLETLEKANGPLSLPQLRALKIIDPAAGAGGLLLPFALVLAGHICQQTGSSKMRELRRIFSQQLYAVDLCAGALEDYALRAQLLVSSRTPLRLNILAADALGTYRGELKIKKAFPEVCKQGGFDIVLSNPPYVGQKNHATLFTQLRKNTFWQNYLTPKSDLMYLFFYLSFFLLKPKGLAGFITTPYFTTAAGAHLLRKELKAQGSFLRFINFEEKNLFPDTSQHTLLSVFLKGKTTLPCLVGESKIPLAQPKLQDEKCNFIRTQLPALADSALAHILQKMKAQPYTLSQVARVSNGLMTGCDKISASHLRKFNLPGVKKGTGVFVLSDEEKKQFSLNKYEQHKIKPFFKNSDIAPYRASSCPSHWLIDLFYPNDRDLDLSRYPHLLAHLAHFKPVLLARKQNNNGIQHQLAAGKYWFGSVRRKMNFEGEKLVVPHRAPRPCFAYSKGPWYASSDVYFVSHPQKGYSLGALLALLNSPIYHLWLYYNGKRKGGLLELYAQPLNQLPLPQLSAQQCRVLSACARQITAQKMSPRPKDTAALERKISHLTARIFRLTPQEEARLSHWINTPKNPLAN